MHFLRTLGYENVGSHPEMVAVIRQALAGLLEQAVQHDVGRGRGVEEDLDPDEVCQPQAATNQALPNHRHRDVVEQVEDSDQQR